jgi:UDP-4-amino-4,6-dideoxy-N-acetyl-beta-L-altrosamine N-acetyltransferase
MLSIELKKITSCSDAQQKQIRSVRNQDQVRKSMYTDHEISLAEHTSWLRQLKTDDKQIVFIVLRENVSIGVVSLSSIDKLHKKSDWAFYLDQKQRGGLGAALEFALLNYVFGELGLEKLNCEVIETNESVVRMHKKFSFKEEGFRKSNIVKNGERIGVHLLGLTKSDWYANKIAIENNYKPVLNNFNVRIL